MSNISEQIAAFWNQASSIWLSGGWGMVALAANAVVMLALGMHVLFKLREKKYQSISEETWRRWIDHPNERKGPIGELLKFVTGADSLKQTSIFFEELRSTEIAPFELGLLGTVTGMLATFGALASGSGGEKTMGLIAKGISEALITTETGLVIALPGLFFQYHLSRKLERYKIFLAHIETLCTQKLYKTLREEKLKKASLKPVTHIQTIKILKPICNRHAVTDKHHKQMEKVA